MNLFKILGVFFFIFSVFRFCDYIENNNIKSNLNNNNNNNIVYEQINAEAKETIKVIYSLNSNFLQAQKIDNLSNDSKTKIKSFDNFFEFQNDLNNMIKQVNTNIGLGVKTNFSCSKEVNDNIVNYVNSIRDYQNDYTMWLINNKLKIKSYMKNKSFYDVCDSVENLCDDPKFYLDIYYKRQAIDNNISCTKKLFLLDDDPENIVWFGKLYRRLDIENNNPKGKISVKDTGLVIKKFHDKTIYL